MRRKTISLLLILCMVLALMPTTVFAASDNGTIASNANTTNAMEIVYGGQHWQVIGYNGTGVASEAGTMTLLVKDNVGTSAFSSSTNEYSGSALQTAVDAIATSFAAREKATIISRTLSTGTYLASAPYCDGIAGAQVDNALLWPLSTKEATEVDVELREISADYWWLRSPGNGGALAAFVTFNGSIVTDGWATANDVYVRPAFKLDMSKVLFTSAAVGGKAEAAGAALSAVTAPSGVQKLTVLDSGLALGTAATTDALTAGSTVSVSYTGAITGKTLSAIVVNTGTGAVTYYGKLVDSIVAADGTASVTLPAGFDSSTMTLKLFVEEINGDNLTDYASAPVAVTVNAPASGAPTSGAVTYDGNGATSGSVPIDANSPYPAGASATVLDNTGALLRTGYTFAGWSTSSTATEADYIAGSTITMTNPVTLYAVWIPFTFTSDGSQITITGYLSSDTVVTVPETVNKLPVKVIGDNAFKSQKLVKTITLPSSIVTIGDYAFYECSILNDINIPSGVTSIGKHAFNQCFGLINITIPSGVTSIGEYTFYLCQKLTSINVPSGVTSIGDYAFAYCTRATSINIPSGVTSIGANTFQHCAELKNITIPSGVTSIGTYAFMGCAKLANITIPSSVKSIGTAAFQACRSFTSIDLPSSVTSVDSSVFSFCDLLTSVTLPSNITAIGAQAFRACPSLTRITIPSSVTRIEGNAFLGDTELATAMFEGNAPADFGTSVFDVTAPGFKILYNYSNSGWSTPTWKGYPAYPLCNVTYDANHATSGSVAIDATSPYEAGATVTVIGNTGTLVRTGYTFLGWNTAANGSGTNYAAGATFAMGSAPVILYAQWAGNYTVTFKYRDGTTADTTKTVTYGQPYGALPTPTRAGYTFAGWYTATTGGTQVTASDIVAITAAQTLYAQWNAEITGFVAIADVPGGTIVAPTYTNSAAVIAALPTSITANTAGGTVTVPVLTWVDTDSYNTSTPGSYTFTATLGTLPNGSANSGNYTATVEVVITSGDPSMTIKGGGFWFTTWTDNSDSKTYDIIRYGSVTVVNANNFVDDLDVVNGYVEVYKGTTLLRSTQAGSTATSSTTNIGTGVKVRLYTMSGTLFKEYFVVMKGDIDGDGLIKSLDASMLKKYISSSLAFPITGVNKYAADVNYNTAVGKTGDGLLKATDASRLSQYVSSSSSFPINQTQATSN